MNRNIPARPPEHPRCVGSAAYGPHEAHPPRAYTVVTPLGKVIWACDSDCLARYLAQLEARAVGDIRRSLRRIVR